MKVRHLIDALKELPQDASVELSRVVAANKVTHDVYELRLDYPIIGLALSKQGADVLLVVEYDVVHYLDRFGKLHLLQTGRGE